MIEFREKMQNSNHDSTCQETEKQASVNTKKLNDALFEPSVEMMVNDFDDERTLEEEEALAADEDPNAELSDLQKESDMPIEELLALYKCGTAPKISVETHISPSSASSVNENEEQNFDEEPSELLKLYPEAYNPNDQRLLRTFSRPPSEDEEDAEYNPDKDDFKKCIMVGNEFQAIIPEGLCRYDDALPYENDDKLLWDPSKLSDFAIEEYLFKSHSATTASQKTENDKTNVITKDKYIRDDEQALYLLLQCGQNIEEALRRRRINSLANQTDSMSIWSEEECRNFENGLRSFGKDFHSIQQTKVRTRSVGELVQFYYLWKKTERHDVFANKSRLEKKKYNLHPGVTDYMDRFLEEQENGGGSNGSTNSLNSFQNTGRDRSSSPGINSLLYADTKHHRRIESSTNVISHIDSKLDQNEANTDSSSKSSKTIDAFKKAAD